MSRDNPFLGIMLMFGFCLLAPMGDAVAKLLAGQVPVGQLVLIRFSVQVLLLVPFVALTRRPWRMHGRVLWLTFVRTLLHILGIGMMFSALQYLPLADAIAIAFIMPFIMLLLGHYVLQEEVGMRRFLACMVGFVGTLMVVQPAFADVGWPALLPMGVAVSFSLFMLVTRQIARQTDPVGIQMVSGVMAVALMTPVLLLVPQDTMAVLNWVTPHPGTWTLLLALGGLGTMAHLLMTWSLRFAPSATLAPMQYLEIPIATLIGFFVFGDWPNPLASLGICITIASGLYIVFRERAIGQARPPTPPAPPPDPSVAT